MGTFSELYNDEANWAASVLTVLAAGNTGVPTANILTPQGLTFAPSPRIEIEVDPSPDLRPALADPSQLGSAPINLAINARDAMPDGGTLTLTAANRTVTAAERSLIP